MPKVYTTDTIIERFKIKNKHNFDYSKVTYGGMDVPVTVVCPIHGDIMLSPSQILRNVGCPKCVKDKLTELRTNRDDFIKESNEIHRGKYDYSKVEYKGVATKVCIICPEHGEFWQTPRNHLKGCGCQRCSLERHNETTRLSTESFISKAMSIHGDKYDYSKVDYVDTMTKVCITCPIHGDFYQTPNKHLLGQGCPKCSKTQRLTKDDFIKRAKQIQDDVYDYSKVNYVNNSTKVCIICPEHGEFWQTPHNHLTGRGCPMCKNKKISISETKTTEQFVEEARKVHGYKYDYSRTKYLSAKNKVCIICPVHGEFWQEASSHLSGCGCPKCNHIISRAEMEITDYIRSLYDGEIITNSRNLLMEHKELDIYLPSLRIAFEYNGMIWHSDRFRVDANYHLDKTEECLRNGIKLYHIFEYEWIHKQEIVKNKIRHILGVDVDEDETTIDCVISDIDKETANDFNERHNIQGHSNSSAHIGVSVKNKLIFVVSLTKVNEDKWRIDRLTYDEWNTSVGESMLNYFVDKYCPSEIEAFDDRRWVASLLDSPYSKFDFKFDGTLPPDYGYTKGQNDYITKEGLRECRLDKENGYYRIYDCGMYRYVWKNED